MMDTFNCTALQEGPFTLLFTNKILQNILFIIKQYLSKSNTVWAGLLKVGPTVLVKEQKLALMTKSNIFVLLHQIQFRHQVSPASNRNEDPEKILA